jgi:hypothetical protein
MVGRTNTEKAEESSAPMMWWHLIPRLAPVLTGQGHRAVGHIRGVLWAACEYTRINNSYALPRGGAVCRLEAESVLGKRIPTKEKPRPQSTFTRGDEAPMNPLSPVA